MSHIFYILAIFPILWESLSITNPRKVGRFIKTYRTTDIRTTNQKAYPFFALGYALWVILGFFSSQWVLFLAIFMLGYIIPKRWVITRLIDGVITMSILIFMLINVYHLHIDIYEVIKEFLYK